MKRIISFILAAIIVASCATPIPKTKEYKREVEEHDSYVSQGFMDFSKYSEKGFLITPFKYDRPYKSIGFIRVTLYPEIKKINEVAPGMHDTGNADTIRVKRIEDSIDQYKYMIVVTPDNKKYKVSRLKQNMVIDEIYKVSKNAGADAIVNFDFDRDYETNGSITHEVLEVTGFAIKRTD